MTGYNGAKLVKSEPHWLVLLFVIKSNEENTNDC